MKLFGVPSPRLEYGVLGGSRKREGLGLATGMGVVGRGSGSFLQEAVGGVLIAVTL